MPDAMHYEQQRVEEPLQCRGRMELRLQTVKDLMGMLDE